MIIQTSFGCTDYRSFTLNGGDGVCSGAKLAHLHVEHNEVRMTDASSGTEYDSSPSILFIADQIIS